MEREGRGLGDGVAMVEAMKNVSFDGKTGPVSLDARGDMIETISVLNYVLAGVVMPDYADDAAAAATRMISVGIGVFDATTQRYSALDQAAAVSWPGGGRQKPESSLGCEPGSHDPDGTRQCLPCLQGYFSDAVGFPRECAECAAGARIYFWRLSAHADGERRGLDRVGGSRRKGLGEMCL